MLRLSQIALLLAIAAFVCLLVFDFILKIERLPDSCVYSIQEKKMIQRLRT